MNSFRFGLTTVLSVVTILATIINCGYSISTPNKEDFFTINITMNNYETKQEDEYGYLQYKLPDEELLIVGYLPLINMNSVHHILSFACVQPSSDKPYWTGGNACNGQQMIIHDWARNAPLLTLPEDVGIAVGSNTPYKYIVVSIHYLPILKNDNSGIQLIMTRKSRKYHAGIVLGGTSDIYLKPKTHTIRTPFSCQYSGPPISIFAVHVHTHQWGRVNSLYRVRDGEISQIVKSNPQWSQAFYPLPSAVEIRNNDYMVGQCVYDNDDDRVIKVGRTHNDEMCNVYAMYSYEPPKTSSGESKRDSPPIRICWGNGARKMASLIPPESDIPLLKPANIDGIRNDRQAHTEHTMNSFKTNLYKNVQDWPDIKSLPIQFGEIGGIALNNANNELIVFHRGSRKWESEHFNQYRFRHEDYGPIEDDVLIHIDTHTGETKFRWGANKFFMPHGLTIDHEGNYWLTDITMHQVFMFKPNDLNQPALVIGEMFQSGSGQNKFCRPADVAVMINGDFFVADGYCNSRIIKFNRKGEYITEWGSSMTGKLDSDGFPLPNEWNIVHSIALNEDAQLLCGADRENFRIQCFNSNTGEFQRQIRIENKETIGAIYAIEFARNTNGTILFVVTGGTQTSNKKVYMIDAQNGEILTSFDSNPHLITPHDITVSTNAREIYVGELASSPSNVLHKFELSKQRDDSKETFNKRINVSDENFRTSLIIMAVFTIPVLASVIIGCIIQIKNKRKFDRLNIFLNVANNGDTDSSSDLGGWIYRRKGFMKLEQHSDGENEPLDNHVADDSNNNSDDETITITTKQQATTFNNKKDSITSETDDDL